MDRIAWHRRAGGGYYQIYVNGQLHGSVYKTSSDETHPGGAWACFDAPELHKNLEEAKRCVESRVVVQ